MEIQLSDLNLTYLLGWYGTCETQEEFDLTTIAEHIESVSMYATDNTTLKEYNPTNGVEDFTSLVPGHIYSFIFKQSDFQSLLNIPHLVTTNNLTESTLRVVEFCEPLVTPTPLITVDDDPGDIGDVGGIGDIGGGYGDGAGSITPTPMGNNVPTPSPVVNHSCCIDENQKHTLDSGVKKITNYDNTSFVSQHDGVICWKELSADMIDGNEVLYYVSFETELDKVDLEVLVQTSQTIYDDVVFEFPNGDCYMGNLTDMTPTLNRFTLVQSSGGNTDQPNDTDSDDNTNGDDGCCHPYETKYNLVADQETVSNQDNTSFVSKNDGAICWQGMDSSQMNYDETLYHVALGDSDESMLEVRVQTSSPIQKTLVFEDLSGNCYIGSLEFPHPSINRLFLQDIPTPSPIISGDGTSGSYGATPTPFYPFATPTPYNPDLDGGVNSTPYPTPDMPPMGITPTPYNPDTIDPIDPGPNSDFDLDLHLDKRQSFSARVNGMGYLYDIEYLEGSKMGFYSVFVDDTNQVIEVTDVNNGNNISTSGFRTMAGTFQYLQNLFEQGVSITSCDYHPEEDYIVYANGDFDGFTINNIRYNANISDDNPQMDGDNSDNNNDLPDSDPYYDDEGYSNDGTNSDDDPYYDDGGYSDDAQLDGVYSDTDYDDANQESPNGAIPDVDISDPLDTEIPDTIYDPVVNDYVSIDDLTNGGVDTDDNNSEYLDLEKTPNEEDETGYDPIDDIVDNGEVDVDPLEQYEPIVDEFEPPMDDPILDDSLDMDDVDVDPIGEFEPPMDDPILDDNVGMDDVDVDPIDEFEPPMDDPILDDIASENSGDTAFEDITLGSFDQSYDLVENQILDATDSNMDLAEFQGDDSDENGEDLIFRNI